MKVKLDNGAYLPQRGHPMDAGLDFRAPYSFSIYPGERKVINTGVHAQLPTDSVGIIAGKSRLMREKGVISQGIVDASYRDSIHIILINTSKQIVDFEVGERIAQLIIVPCLFVDIEEAQELPIIPYDAYDVKEKTE